MTTLAKRRSNSPYAAFVRGINVGGANVIAMRDLRALCTRAGCTDVETYIQSGNVVFRHALPPGQVEDKLAAALARLPPDEVCVQHVAEMKEPRRGGREA